MSICDTLKGQKGAIKMARTVEERIEVLRQKQEQLKAQEKQLKAQLNERERKARTRRLIIIGGEAEKVLGRPFTDDDISRFSAFLEDQNRRGGYFSDWMNNPATTQEKTVESKNKAPEDYSNEDFIRF